MLSLILKNNYKQQISCWFSHIEFIIKIKYKQKLIIIYEFKKISGLYIHNDNVIEYCYTITNRFYLMDTKHSCNSSLCNDKSTYSTWGGDLGFVWFFT